MPPNRLPAHPTHIFVLMLENRSYDHLLGFTALSGTTPDGQATRADGLTGSESTATGGRAYPVQEGGYLTAPHDPPHEFHDVRLQVCGPGRDYPDVPMDGFAESYRATGGNPGEVMACFTEDQVPVLTTLAREYAVCDRWFSSLPGPTWPNRFFVHAATAGTQYDSPTAAQMVGSDLLDGWDFANGHIFDRLDRKRIPWRIYHGDGLPQVFALDGMTWDRMRGRYAPLVDPSAGPGMASALARDLQDPGFAPRYVFIEPDYGHVLSHGGDFTGGNSQHPVDDLRAGEELIRDVYLAIRSSPLWPQSLLIITYDEHGGFYDHVPPPPATPPGDAPFSTGDPARQGRFAFDRYGVRVPAVVVSPWIRRGTIDHTLYDHTSILATIERLFQVKPLTRRDAAANDLLGLLTLDQARTDAPEIPRALAEASVARSRLAAIGPFADPRSLVKASPQLMAFAHLALKKRLQAAGRGQAARQHLISEFAAIGNRTTALSFISAAVAPRHVEDGTAAVATRRIPATKPRASTNRTPGMATKTTKAKHPPGPGKRSTGAKPAARGKRSPRR